MNYIETRLNTSSGTITKDPAREKQWVTTWVVRRMVQTYMESAITDGTLNWDIVISRCLNVVLAAAAAARAGDLARSQYYTNDTALRYQHVKIIVYADETGAVSFKMQLTLAFSKGSK